MGGLRLAKTTMYDGLGKKATERFFKYEDPIIINPINLSEYVDTTNEFICGNVTYNIINRNSNTKFALGSIQGGTIGYGTVTTLTDSLGTNGKTVSVFSNEPDYGTSESKIFPYPATNPRDYKRGLLLSQTDYRTDNNKIKEIIFALSATIEGDTTIYYIYKQINNNTIIVSTIARGIGVGDELEYADEVTLSRSIINRIPYQKN